MTDDLLKAATQALREESLDHEGAGRITRARVMASLHQGTVQRRTRLALLLPIAACFAAGTAWGAATGRLPVLFDSIVQSLGYTSQRRPAAVVARPVPRRASEPDGSAALAEAAVPAPAPASPVQDEARLPPAVPEVLAAPSPAGASEGFAPSRQPRSVRSASPLASAAFQDNDGDLYRLAHEAHFAQRDYARAFAAWEAYLSAAPAGRLASEARYNRALCLLRLGRAAEAKQALEPFASGKTAGYRQSDARKLLEELGH